jgi:transposase-like protein
MKNAFEFKTLTEFTDYFQDEKTCVDAFTQIRFRNGEYCPHCGHTHVHKFSDGKRYRCAKCKQDFTIKTKSIFGESKLPIRKWFIAIYLLTTTSKGMSSVQLAKHVGVCQKTAWFMAHRIRQATQQGKGQLFGTIEMDECYIGGLEKNKHASKRKQNTRGRSTSVKMPVVGMVQRGGEIRATAVSDCSMRTIESQLVTNAKIGSRIHTDDFLSYARVGRFFPHKTIAHGAGKYVDGDVHTNTIESFWALFKRGYHGVYHQMSRKHLQRYLNEFAFRFNRRQNEMVETFADVVEKVSQSVQLPYKTLTGQPT